MSDHKQRSLVHQLVDILEAYQASFAQWCQQPGDVGRYDRARANLDLVRVLTDKAFPGGRGELGELLLYHGELKLLVLRRHIARGAGRSLPASAEEQLDTLRGRHDAMLTALRVVCGLRGGAARPAAPRSPEIQRLGPRYPLADT